MITEETLYTVNEAARALRLSPWTLWDHLKQGLLVRTKIGGKTFLRESELKKLIRDVRSEPHEPRSKVHKPVRRRRQIQPGRPSTKTKAVMP
jgi:helix-turn-helix protein